MNIAFFTDSYLPNTDGVVRSILGYKRELEERGHTVFIFCPGTKKQRKENTEKNIFYFTSASFKPYPDYRIALFPFFTAVRRVKECKVDIIHSHGIATTGLAAIQCSKKLKIPAIASFHTLVPEGVHYLTKNPTVQDFFRSIAWKYLKWYYSQFNIITVPSNYMKKILEEHGIARSIVIPTGVDNMLFNSSADGSEIRKKYKLKNDPLILHVGRVASEKKIELLIDAADNILNIYPEARFMIVGKGPAMEYYIQLVNSKNLSKSFIFTDYVPDSELPKYYAAADVFVFLSDFDTQGLVVLEALAVGTPVVVRKDSASAEFVRDSSSAYLFSDHFDLPEKILNAIKDKDKLKSNIKNEENKYTIKNSTARLLEMYGSMLSSP